MASGFGCSWHQQIPVFFLHLRYTYRMVKAMLGQDGPRVVDWIRARYAEQRKTQLYDELDDEDEDDIILVRRDVSKRTRTGKGHGEL